MKKQIFFDWVLVSDAANGSMWTGKNSKTRTKNKQK